MKSGQEKLREREFDGSWKKVLEKLFWQFLDFYFPKIGEQVEKEKGYSFLDQELAKITRDSKSGSRRVDKLAKVYTKEEKELWVLVHVEVQSYKDEDFAKRMLLYFMRIWEKYQKPVASLAILTDDKKDFRPSSYTLEAFGKEFLQFQFPISKLLDYRGQEKELENNPNPFAIVTLASLETYEKDHQKRFFSKYHLTKLLYDRGYSKETILDLYEFLDGILVLPKKMEQKYNEKLHEYEKEKKVAYITTAERIGMEKATQKAILEVLEARFGKVCEEISSQISEITDEEQLSLLLKKAATVVSFVEFTEIFSD